MFDKLIGAVASGYMTKKIMEDEKRPGHEAGLKESQDIINSYIRPQDRERLMGGVPEFPVKVPVLSKMVKFIGGSKKNLSGALKDR